MSVSEFTGVAASAEMDVSTKGLRVFQVKENSLPAGVHVALCSFRDNKLAALELEVSQTEPWTIAVAKPIADFGAPKTLMDALEVQRISMSSLEETAAWVDKGGAFVIGRNSDKRFVAIYDRSGFGVLREQVASAKKSGEEQQAAAEDLLVDMKAASAVIENEISEKNLSSDRIKDATQKALDSFEKLKVKGLWDPKLNASHNYLTKLARVARDKRNIVASSEGWQRVGVEVRGGELLILSASGRWRMSPSWAASGPEGLPSGKRAWILSAAGHPGALLCKIGGGNPFAVGEIVRVKIGEGEGGNVECGPNDTDVSNNSGTIALKALVVPLPPETP
jgi:hypothetical protein